MRILLRYPAHLAPSCKRWVAVPVTTPPDGPVNSLVDHYTAPATLEPGETSELAFNRIRKRLFIYDIFPSWIIDHALCPPGEIAEGTTIVQRVLLGPIAWEMAVRVVAVWDRRDGNIHEVGFRYATVEGHAECGVADFQVRHDEAVGVTVLIEARSLPGTPLTRFGRPAARLFQYTITKLALRRLAGS